MKVGDILAVKGAVAITIKPTETVGALSQLLREKRIGAAIVSENGQTIDGVITERDIAYGLTIHKSGLYALPIADLMTKTVITCTASDTVGLVASTMLSRNFRHIPVVKDKNIVGMVSIRDLLNFRVNELQQETAMLHTLVNSVETVPQDR